MLTINDLPDDVLLAIFDFYVVRYQDLDFSELRVSVCDAKARIESWQSLVHVSRRWRGLVFGSPRRLNLQLFFIPGVSSRKTVDVWPAFPLLIHGGSISEASVDDIIAELEHSDRICEIDIGGRPNPQIEKLWTAMQMPFPELAGLYLSFRGLGVPTLPDSFLGGSAPRLESLSLTSVPFPALPKLLLSVTHLVYLRLSNIPHSGYISPEAMATCLSALTSLKSFQVRFNSPQSSPDQESRHSRPPTRSILPVLEVFSFKGVNEYLEELVAWIDTPRLRLLSATFFNDIDFDTQELIRFVSHSSILKAPNEAYVFFDSRTASVKLRPQVSIREYFQVIITCREPVWQLSSLAQICTTSFPLLSTTENLFICEQYDLQLDWEDNIENIQWLELLLPFTAVKNLYLSKQFVPRVASALQEIVGDGTTTVLSTLQNLYLEGFEPSESLQEDIERFVSARQLTNHPVSISVWEKESKQWAFYD